MKYKVEIWCYDCTGIDPMGCFDGKSEFLDKNFDDLEEATRAGWDKVWNTGPWEFNVFDENDKRVFSSYYD